MRLSAGKKCVRAATASLPLTPVYRLAVEAADSKHEVNNTAALGKLMEEDPSLRIRA